MMKILIRILSVVLAVTIPVTSFCLGANVVTRMPDGYQYEFKATDALKHINLEKNNDEMGEFISDFMIGKELEFQLGVGDEDRFQTMFTENEMIAAANARKYMNIVAVIGAISLVLMVTSFIILKKHKFDREIRKEFRRGTIIYMVLMIGYLVGFYVVNKIGYSFWDMLIYVPGENDLLPQIITDKLMKHLYFFVAIVSTIIMAIVGYVMYKITEPKRIFSRSH